MTRSQSYNKTSLATKGNFQCQEGEGYISFELLGKGAPGKPIPKPAITKVTENKANCWR